MKNLLLAAAIAVAPVALMAPTPASAFGVYVGPYGGVRVGLGRPFYGYRYGYGYRRPFVVARGFYGRPYWHRGWRRF